ncbi:hypothetical protein IQ268_27965 [Oculatella sp. LEGE 06141]|uniref:hypothetical protein n=1 Tax=Oculatella sp. LEGE 06141 TaxID=1828648 RepID=UPI00187FB8F4|nr:hypothetical protein [Oculatella sp. LEGE 06141]MBE9182388.1 hypothetical protein [Oculatella sp. LEGE 06141]
MISFKRACSVFSAAALITAFGLPVIQADAGERSDDEAIASQQVDSVSADDLISQTYTSVEGSTLVQTPSTSSDPAVTPPPEGDVPEQIIEDRDPSIPAETGSPSMSESTSESTSPTESSTVTPPPEGNVPEQIIEDRDPDVPAGSSSSLIPTQTSQSPPRTGSPATTPPPEGGVPEQIIEDRDPNIPAGTGSPSTPRQSGTGTPGTTPPTTPPPEGGVPEQIIEDRDPTLPPRPSPTQRPGQPVFQTPPTDDTVPPADAPTEPFDVDTQGVAPGRTTRSGPSYIGIGGNIGIGDGDTALGDSSFAVFSKVGLTSNLSVRPAVLIEDNPTILLPVTLDFIPAVTDVTENISGDLGLRVSPYIGAGIAISTGDDSTVDFLATGGVDVPISDRISATAAVNATLFDNPAVGLLIGVGLNF